MTCSLAGVMGLNLTEVTRAGRRAPQDCARMASSCRNCAHVGACEA